MPIADKLPKAHYASLGRVMVCPKCQSACREDSQFYDRNKGVCPRDKVKLVPDVDAARVAYRSALYQFPATP